MSEKDEVLLSITQARKKLDRRFPGITRDTVRRAIKDGRLVGKRMGHYWYVRAWSIDTFNMLFPWAGIERRRRPTKKEVK